MGKPRITINDDGARKSAQDFIAKYKKIEEELSTTSKDLDLLKSVIYDTPATTLRESLVDLKEEREVPNRHTQFAQRFLTDAGKESYEREMINRKYLELARSALTVPANRVDETFFKWAKEYLSKDESLTDSKKTEAIQEIPNSITGVVPGEEDLAQKLSLPPQTESYDRALHHPAIASLRLAYLLKTAGEILPKKLYEFEQLSKEAHRMREEYQKASEARSTLEQTVRDLNRQLESERESNDSTVKGLQQKIDANNQQYQSSQAFFEDIRILFTQSGMHTLDSSDASTLMNVNHEDLSPASMHKLYQLSEPTTREEMISKMKTPLGKIISNLILDLSRESYGLVQMIEGAIQKPNYQTTVNTEEQS